jgi:multicomponent Na+:H+ antiporter subunit B
LKVGNYIILITFFVLMIYASLGFPNRGDANARMNREKSLAGSVNAPSYYIHYADRDAHTPNMVTVILADYRGYDTLGEETVILTAGLICFLLLRKKRTANDQK